jgi:hypothetical protein
VEPARLATDEPDEEDDDGADVDASGRWKYALSNCGGAWRDRGLER